MCFAPWFGIDGDGSSTVEQTGVATDRSGGSPFYQAWYEMYPAAPVYYSNPVRAGGKITATVTRTVTTTYRLDISDTTKGWSNRHQEDVFEARIGRGDHRIAGGFLSEHCGRFAVHRREVQWCQPERDKPGLLGRR
jgi:hypothetical protein